MIGSNIRGFKMVPFLQFVKILYASFNTMENQEFMVNITRKHCTNTKEIPRVEGIKLGENKLIQAI